MRSRQQGIVLTGYVVGALVLLLVIACGAFWLDHRELKKEIADANDKIVASEKAQAKEEESRKGFQAAAGSCSASIDKLVDAQTTREKWYQGQLSASRAQTAKAEETARTILSSRRPDGMNECDATRKELNDEVDRRHPAR